MGGEALRKLHCIDLIDEDPTSDRVRNLGFATAKESIILESASRDSLHYIINAKSIEQEKEWEIACPDLKRIGSWSVRTECWWCMSRSMVLQHPNCLCLVYTSTSLSPLRSSDMPVTVVFIYLLTMRVPISDGRSVECSPGALSSCIRMLMKAYSNTEAVPEETSEN